MENLKKYGQFILEWIDSPGSVDVSGQDFETKVNSRNYTPARQPLPEVVDGMFEKSYFNKFLDDAGKSEEFNKFLKEGNKTGSEVTDYIKDSFENEISKRD